MYPGPINRWLLLADTFQMLEYTVYASKYVLLNVIVCLSVNN